MASCKPLYRRPKPPVNTTKAQQQQTHIASETLHLQDYHWGLFISSFTSLSNNNNYCLGATVILTRHG